MTLKPGETVVKRVMKRQDLKGNGVEPKPILNAGDSKMRYAFEYLYGNTFKEGTLITDYDVETTNHIDLQERIFDIEAYMLKEHTKNRMLGTFDDIENALPMLVHVFNDSEANILDYSVAYTMDKIESMKANDEIDEKFYMRIKDFLALNDERISIKM